MLHSNLPKRKFLGGLILGGHSMQFDIQARLRRELSSDENLLWSGVPTLGLRFRAADILMVPFSLVWGGFAFFWEAEVLYGTGVRLSASPPYVTATLVSFIGLWGVPFCLVGLYLIFGRFFFDAAARAKTIYAITDRRVMVARGNSVRSLALNALPAFELKEGGNGRGSIVFGPSTFFTSTGWPARNYRQYGQPLILDGIANAREVYALIVDTAHKSGSR